MIQGTGNTIHPTAQIDDNVRLGSYNRIGQNVVLSGFKGNAGSPITIGDCNDIHDGTRLLIGPGGCAIGDWNVFHNSMLVMGDGGLSIGHNCWFGQNTILDASGGLTIGNGVRVGMYSQIWTHVASGELVEGCTLFAHRPTLIADDVWLVGSCIVGSGLEIGRRTICLIGSLLTKSTPPGSVFGGSPARPLEGLNFYRQVSLEEKVEMMRGWATAFCSLPGNNGLLASFSESEPRVRIVDSSEGSTLLVGAS